MSYLKYLLLFPALLFAYQMYRYTISLQRFEQQRACRSLGILITTAGIVSLVVRDAVFVIAGLVMMMVGFRLIAFGLDRKDKKVYIDRYDEGDQDNTP